ncbi:MAG: hypothetical protein ACJA1B_002271 [Polaribacter sp.]|jgi:hypothetical protein
MIHDTNNYWEQLERLEKLIRASEFKAGIVFSFHSLILGFFADRLENFKFILQESVLFIILLILWFLSVLISIYYCFRCFKPHMELTYDKNVFFFKDAVCKFGSTEEYAKELIDTCSKEEKIVQQLSEQIHAESVIIEKKFFNVKKAIQYFILSFIFVAISLSYWMYYTIS